MFTAISMVKSSFRVKSSFHRRHSLSLGKCIGSLSQPQEGESDWKSQLDEGESDWKSRLEEGESDRTSREIPSCVDWRTMGAVTPVKSQIGCGCCWAFTAIGAIEGLHKILTGCLITLSTQQLVDCDRSFNKGCDGGLAIHAYNFVVANGGIASDEDYPYVGHECVCKEMKSVVSIGGYRTISPGNEEEILRRVAMQPVSIRLAGAFHSSFISYKGGIYKGTSDEYHMFGHAALIVGYGSQGSEDYWIVKNTWGTSWGINGYMHLLRNSGNAVGTCWINMAASYPINTTPNPPPHDNPIKALDGMGWNLLRRDLVDRQVIDIDFVFYHEQSSVFWFLSHIVLPTSKLLFDRHRIDSPIC